MLVLTRKEGEEIVILMNDGRKIVITAGHISRSRVTIGISAPEDVKVLRRELAKKETDEEAA